jgi:hypothetical protein
MHAAIMRLYGQSRTSERPLLARARHPARTLAGHASGFTLDFPPAIKIMLEEPIPKLLSESELAGYRDRGYHFPIDTLSTTEVADFRRNLEDYEAASGGPIKAEMRHRSHVLFTWIDEMIRHQDRLSGVTEKQPHVSVHSSALAPASARTRASSAASSWAGPE